MTGNGGTIPSFLTITTDRPDIVILDRKSKTVDIFELTVPFESNITSRNIFKNNKYAYLCSDISDYTAKVTAFEIGVRGTVTEENRKRLKSIHTFCDKKVSLKTFTNNISAIAINSSYLIYNYRKSPTWGSPCPFKAPF